MASDKAEAIRAKLEQRALRAGFLKPYTKIEDDLYLGGKAGSDGINNYKVAEYPKTDAILGVNEHPPVVPQNGRLDYKASLWMPIHDRPPFPGVDWLCTAVDFICNCNEAGWSVYVHCSVGASRSFMVVAAYLMKKYGYEPEEALNKLSLKRAGAPQAAFIDGLFEYYDFLHETTKTKN